MYLNSAPGISLVVRGQALGRLQDGWPPTRHFSCTTKVFQGMSAVNIAEETPRQKDWGSFVLLKEDNNTRKWYGCRKWEFCRQVILLLLTREFVIKENIRLVCLLDFTAEFGVITIRCWFTLQISFRRGRNLIYWFLYIVTPAEHYWLKFLRTISSRIFSNITNSLVARYLW